jgi:outer membrane protein TolC
VPTALAAGGIAEARAAQTEAQRNALRDGLRAEVMQAQNALREAQVALQTTARALVAAEESYRVRRELFKNGRATNLEVTDAENNLLRARYESINARVDLRIALVNLEHALGRDVKRATP